MYLRASLNISTCFDWPAVFCLEIDDHSDLVRIPRPTWDTGAEICADIRGPRRRVEEGTATAVARRCASCVTVRGERFPHIVAGHSSFYIAALLRTCAIRTTLAQTGAYRQVSPGSADSSEAGVLSAAANFHQKKTQNWSK